MGSLEDLDKAFAALEKQFPEARRELVEDAGAIMYERVTRNIDEETQGAERQTAGSMPSGYRQWRWLCRCAKR